MSRLSTILIALALLVLAAGLVWFSRSRDTETEYPTLRNESGHRQMTRSPDTSTGEQSPGTALMPEVIRLTRTDWKRLFATEYSHVSKDDQIEIIDLAAELDHALSTGGRADSEDARVYVDAILSLLNESIPE